MLIHVSIFANDDVVSIMCFHAYFELNNLSLLSFFIEEACLVDALQLYEDYSNMDS